MRARHQILSLAVLPILVAAGWPACAAESVEALIKRQSQQFSDASASGDRAALDRYLDDRVAFMNEGGVIASKADLLAGAVPGPKGVSNSLTQTDFALQMHGQVAVTTFTDVSTVLAYGQVLHARYRSTEVWLDEQGHWRMIASQTTELADDPPAVTLPREVLDQYVGTYQAGPDFIYKIARDGDELTGSVGGGAPVAIKAELLDVFFTPGRPDLRRIFQRDAGGKVTGFISRREGHDLVLKRVS